MYDWEDRRLYLFAPLPASVDRAVTLMPELACAWRGRTLVAPVRRHMTLLNLSISDLPLSRVIRLARRFVADALPEAFRINLDELVMTRDRALLAASEWNVGARRCQDRLLQSAAERGLELPRKAAPRPHVTLGYGYAEDRATVAIDGLSWQVNELRLVLSHHGRTLHEQIDAWQLPERRRSAA
jgi:2'-5' RNA ligase